MLYVRSRVAALEPVVLRFLPAGSVPDEDRGAACAVHCRLRPASNGRKRCEHTPAFGLSARDAWVKRLSTWVWQSLVSPKTRVFGAFGATITECLLWRLIPTELA